MNYENLETEFLQYASIVKLSDGQEMTPTEISAAITAIRAGVDVFKGIKELSNKVANLEEDRAIHSMAHSIHSMDRALFELEKELLAKDKEIAQLKNQLVEPKEKLVLRKIGNYWHSDEDTENPVCKACYDSQSKTITLSGAPSMIQEVFGHKYTCPVCKTTS